MKRYFYFYDINEILIDRYPAQISNVLKENWGLNSFVFIYSEKYQNSIPKKVPTGSKIYYLPDLSKNKIEALFVKYPPNSLITVGQRIPDIWLVALFNKKRLPTFTLQHGLWSDHLERMPIIQLVFSKSLKFFSYARFALNLCKILNLPYLKTLREMYKFFYIEGISIQSTQYLRSRYLRAKTAFVFDESWDKYYTDKFGYSKDDLVYIGNPDFLMLKDKDIDKKEDAVCYLCQTLVEDGRYSLKEYEVFLQKLIDAVTLNSKKKLYLKFHPRSRTENYQIFDLYDNIEITHDFPICNYYIGHYTSLLAVSYIITENIMIWKLNDHHMPQYFNQFASCITDKPEDLTSFVKGEIIVNKENNSYKSMSHKELKDFDPIGKIAEVLVN